jgi:5'-deoxynucleotidase YfbR-like HD superfamily hydrolase
MKTDTTKLGEFRTYTGQTVDVFNPDPATINIQDIAHSLSMQCRFGGHTNVFYSVAQHSIAVMDRVPENLKLTALLHDASEAYLLDFPRPIKKQVRGYEALEEEIERTIAAKFGLHYPYPDEIKQADKEELANEWKVFMIDKHRTINGEVRPIEACVRFLSAYQSLTESRHRRTIL